MNTNPVVVTSGVASEYVLGPLCTFLRDEGLEVIEFDCNEVTHDLRPDLQRLLNRDVVYITSAHTNITRDVASAIAPHLLELYPNYLSPLEIMPILKPRVAIYVPHDLLSSFGEPYLEEWRFLDLYDHILAPYDVGWLEERVEPNTTIHLAGWIKYSQTDAGPVEGQAVKQEGSRDEGHARITFFLSFIEHLLGTYGVDGVVDYVAPILDPGVRIKLPAWPGVDKVERAIQRRTQAVVVEASANSIDLIKDSDLVVCNGASSIQAESILMGVPSICLLDSEAEEADIKREKLAEFPQIRFHDYTRREPIPSSLYNGTLAQNLPRQLKPFDFDMVKQLVTGDS